MKPLLPCTLRNELEIPEKKNRPISNTWRCSNPEVRVAVLRLVLVLVAEGQRKTIGESGTDVPLYKKGRE